MCLCLSFLCTSMNIYQTVFTRILSGFVRYIVEPKASNYKHVKGNKIFSSLSPSLSTSKNQSPLTSPTKIHIFGQSPFYWALYIQGTRHRRKKCRHRRKKFPRKYSPSLKCTGLPNQGKFCKSNESFTHESQNSTLSNGINNSTVFVSDQNGPKYNMLSTGEFHHL